MPKIVVVFGRERVDLSRFVADLSYRLQYRIVDPLQLSYNTLKQLNVKTLMIDGRTGPYETFFSGLLFQECKLNQDPFRLMTTLHTNNIKLLGKNWLDIVYGLNNNNSSNIIVTGVYSQDEIKLLKEMNALFVFIDVVPLDRSQEWIEKEDSRLYSLFGDISKYRYNPEISLMKDLVFQLTKKSTT